MNRFALLSLGLALALLPIAAQASKWVAVDTSKQETTYVDTDSIKVKKDRVYANEKGIVNNFLHPVRIKYGYNANMYMVTHAYDCTNKTVMQVNPMEVMAIDGHFLGYDESMEKKVLPIKPDSSEARRMNYVCTQAGQGAQQTKAADPS